MRVYYDSRHRVTGYSRWNQPRSFLVKFWYVVFGAALLGWPIAVIPGWFRWGAEVIWLVLCGLVFLVSRNGPGPQHRTGSPRANTGPDAGPGPGPRDWTPAGK